MIEKTLATLFAAAAFAAAASGALAQAPKGYEKFYDGPTKVNFAGRPVIADISLHAAKRAAERGDLRVVLVTDVTPFVEETARDLENWVATNQARCGERWKASEPRITFPDGEIGFSVDVELEVYNCGFFGRGDPNRIAREAGRVDVVLDPYAEDGKLQARLRTFTVTERQGVSKYLPLETVAKRFINSEIDKLNKNVKFYRPPNPLYREGLGYLWITGKESDAGAVIITARFHGKGEGQALDRIARDMAAEGLTQDRTRP